LNWKNGELFTDLFWNYFWMNEPQKITELKEFDPVITSAWQKQGQRAVLFKGAEFYLSGQLDSALHYLDSIRRMGPGRIVLSGAQGFQTYFLVVAKIGNTDSLISVLEQGKRLFSASPMLWKFKIFYC